MSESRWGGVRGIWLAAAKALEEGRRGGEALVPSMQAEEGREPDAREPGYVRPEPTSGPPLRGAAHRQPAVRGTVEVRVESSALTEVVGRLEAALTRLEAALRELDER